jgi:hypothetical protein
MGAPSDWLRAHSETRSSASARHERDREEMTATAAVAHRARPALLLRRAGFVRAEPAAARHQANRRAERGDGAAQTRRSGHRACRHRDRCRGSPGSLRGQRFRPRHTPLPASGPPRGPQARSILSAPEPHTKDKGIHACAVQSGPSFGRSGGVAASHTRRDLSVAAARPSW